MPCFAVCVAADAQHSPLCPGLLGCFNTIASASARQSADFLSQFQQGLFFLSR